MATDRARRAIQTHAFDADSGFYTTCAGAPGARVVDRPTLAAATPLYFGVATPEQGAAVGPRGSGRDFYGRAAS
jgi:alpha,alpha-trehalase